MKSIVIYYSRAAENYFDGEIRHIDKGNTQIIAEKIAEMTGAELFCCEQIVPYSDNYKECVAQASADMRNQARPEVKKFDKDMSAYQTVYICYPNYCGTLPMAMFTLLEQLDFTGKTVKPLCTHEGSGMGKSESALQELCRGAEVKKGLAVKGSKVQDAESALADWI